MMEITYCHFNAMTLAPSPATPVRGSQSWRWPWRVCACCLRCRSLHSGQRTHSDPTSGCPTLPPTGREKNTRLSITETSSPRTSLQTIFLKKRGCLDMRGKLVCRAAGLRLTLGISDSGTPLRRAYRYRCSLPVRSSSMASN